jgi:PBP1b-binding outer membrane lipoprotein LpoB
MQHVKRVLAILVAVLLLAGVASAATTMKLVVNGKTTTAKVAPQFIDNTLMVPAETLIDALGMDMTWDVKTNTLTVTGGDPKALVEKLSAAEKKVAELETQLKTTKAAPSTGTAVTSGDAVKLSDLPITVESDNGMVLVVNKVTVTGSGLTFNITLENTGAATGNSMFSASEVQAGQSKLKFLSQDQTFYDGFLSFYPGMKTTGNVTFSAVPADVKQITWRFSLQAGSDWDRKELTFQVR